MWSTLLVANDNIYIYIIYIKNIYIYKRIQLLTLEGFKFIEGVGQNLYAEKINNSGAENILRAKWQLQTVSTKDKEVESAVCLWVFCFGLSL